MLFFFLLRKWKRLNLALKEMKESAKASGLRVKDGLEAGPVQEPLPITSEVDWARLRKALPDVAV